MEDEYGLLRAPALPAPAKVARQFAGSRMERQVLTQVFDVIWQAARNQRERALDDLGSVALTASGIAQEGVAIASGSTARPCVQKGGIA